MLLSSLLQVSAQDRATAGKEKSPDGFHRSAGDSTCLQPILSVATSWTLSMSRSMPFHRSTDNSCAGIGRQRQVALTQRYSDGRAPHGRTGCRLECLSSAGTAAARSSPQMSRSSMTTDPDAVRRQYAGKSRLVTRMSVWQPTATGQSPQDEAAAAVRGAAPSSVIDVGCSIDMAVTYHVADLHRALTEVRRVLRPGGLFVSVTNGDRHLAALLADAGGAPSSPRSAARTELTPCDATSAMSNGPTTAPPSTTSPPSTRTLPVDSPGSRAAGSTPAPRPSFSRNEPATHGGIQAGGTI